MSSSRTYSHVTGNGSFDNIERYATVNIGGSGKVTFTGTIGEGVTINKNGSGSLIIEGIVGENVTFRLMGSGKLIFIQRPPQSVLDNINKMGSWDIKIPGKVACKKDNSQSSNDFNFSNFAMDNNASGNNYSNIHSSNIATGKNSVAGNFNNIYTSHMANANNIISHIYGNSSNMFSNMLPVNPVASHYSNNNSNNNFNNNTGIINDSDNDSSDDSDDASNSKSAGASISCGNGLVKITRNGTITTYKGNSACTKNNKVFIDGKKARKEDIISEQKLNQNSMVNIQGSNNINIQKNTNQNKNNFVNVQGSNSTDIMNMLGGLNINDNNNNKPSVPPAEDLCNAHEPVRVKNDELDLLSRCSKHLREYLTTAQERERMSDRIKQLNLTKEEKKLFKKFEDPISEEYINIPVCLNEIFHDISTLINWKMIDPITQEEYDPLEIQSGRRLLNELEQAEKDLKIAREAALKKIAEEGDMAPHGGHKFT